MADLEENQVSDIAKTEVNDVKETNTSKMQYTLKERYIIDYAEPLEFLDTNGAKAYSVSDRIDKDKRLFALICNRDTAPRHSILPYIKALKTPHLLNLIEYGVVTDPNSNMLTMALIYKQPLGGRVIDDFADKFEGNEAKVLSVLADLMSSLQDLHSYGIYHRAVRLENLFYLDEAKETIVLGDCAASFPAYHQPAVYETIESLIAKNESRGNGYAKNDVYALGILGIFLFAGKQNLLDLTAQELLAIKMKKGSFSAITENIRLPIPFANLMRGVLTDVPDNRWTISYVLELLENKSSKITYNAVTETTKKAFTIGGQKYYNTYEIAYALMQNPKEAFDAYSSGKMVEWIRNSLENEEMANSLDKALKSTVDNSVNHDLIIAKMCIFLAPHFPIVLGNAALFPPALSKSIYFAERNHEDLNDYYKICNSDLVRLWYLNQDDIRTPANLSEIKNYVTNQAIGFGLDRVMYEFDDDIPCTSKLVEGDYVCTPSKILKALNTNYNNSQEKPYDSNLIAYIRCKLGKKVDGILIDINSKFPALEASAILRLYTMLQNKYGPQQMVKLAQWLSVYSMPLIKSYHNIKYQKFLEKELVKINKSGKLHEILELLENEEARKKDNSEYNIAKKTVKKLISEKNMLMSNDGKWEETAKDLAVKSACFLAVVVMLISFVVNLFGALN